MLSFGERTVAPTLSRSSEPSGQHSVLIKVDATLVLCSILCASPSLRSQYHHSGALKKHISFTAIMKTRKTSIPTDERLPAWPRPPAQAISCPPQIWACVEGGEGADCPTLL